MSYLQIEKADKVATVRLNRPDKHNAFDEHLIAELTQAFRDVASDASVRVVVLAANGPSFSAGADLDWMKRMSAMGRAENERDALALADLMEAIDRCPKPVVAIVQGAAFGGGVGLVACCDIAIASTRASFSLSEVRLGLIPAVISPYVAAAIGPRACRRYFLTAERFDAETAERLGLVHRVMEPEALGTAYDEIVAHLLKSGPNALAAAKDLIQRVAFAPMNDDLRRDTASRIADARASAEGKEGIVAFLEKRKPNWS
ncbi:enoyl-CoA hydratase/isomerase family protein [Dongia deserti]|uniref:enoyl-CoA hydratase/isomerase family protein n=1 Tax=Dongia deserti TaxID=2268030 RepID=UPI000E64DA7A|nr:enoyl-CoA hydratase/isomerase family protein [Dongia deserti]